MIYDSTVPRRDYIQILHDVLASCVKPTKISLIIRKANVSYEKAKLLLDEFVTLGLAYNQTLPIRSKDQRTRRLFQATESGLKWCEDVEDIYNRIKADNMTNNDSEVS